MRDVLLMCFAMSLRMPHWPGQAAVEKHRILSGSPLPKRTKCQLLTSCSL